MTTGSDIDWLECLVRIGSGIMLMLVPLNLFDVPRRFAWNEEMERLSLLNRQIFWVHAWYLCLVLGMLGLLALLLARPLLEPTPLARAITGGLTIFWLLRLVLQWFYYSPQIRRGNQFYTAVHYVFTVMWLLLTAIFALAWTRTMRHG
ncbi:MAG: hypothetical protein ACTHLZ_15450 [Tepidisphaeraceae bacterium]